MIRMLSAVAAILLVLIPVLSLRQKVDARIYMDVNPSLEIELDRKDRVVDVLADNGDADDVDDTDDVDDADDVDDEDDNDRDEDD